MARLIQVTPTAETIREITPANGKDWTLLELYKLLGCRYIEVVHMGGGKIMVIDEEGKLRQPLKPKNALATAEAHAVRAIHPADYIAGDALICKSEELR